METRKAILCVNGTAYPVLVVDTVTTLRERVEIDWERVPEFFGATAPEQIFNYFISDIGHDRDDWSYTEDAHCTYYVEPEWVTLDDPVEVSAPSAHETASTTLQSHVQALLDSYEGMEYEITNVQDSLGDKYGKVIIQFKKKEKV